MPHDIDEAARKCHRRHVNGDSRAKFMLRLPPELHEKLKELAAARYPRTSLNAEIIERINFSFQHGYQPTVDALQQLEARLAVVERFLFGEQKESD
jgi:predicted DNA-binding protein